MTSAAQDMQKYWEKVQLVVTDTKKYSKQKRDIVWKDFVKVCNETIELTSNVMINKLTMEAMRKNNIKKLKAQS